MKQQGLQRRRLWVMTSAVDRICNLGVRIPSARQVVDVSTIKNGVLALIRTWLVLVTPCHVLQRKLAHALEAALPMLITWQQWMAIGLCTTRCSNGKSCKNMLKTMCLINVEVCNPFPLVIASGGCRPMRIATLLSWPISPAWHGIWI